MNTKLKLDKEILSAENTVFRTLRDCLSSKGIKKHGLFIVSGVRAADEMLTRHRDLARDLLVCAEIHDSDSPLVSDVLGIKSRDFSLIGLSRVLFDELDVFGTRQPLLVLRAPEIATLNLSLAPEGLEVLCALGDPANVGGLLRSAAAFGASRVVFLSESASPFHPKAVRAASGTTLLTPLSRGPSIQDLASAAGPIVALDMDGESLARFRWPKDARLLIGEEGLGIPGVGAFTKVAIPMRAGVESLNATVAGGIALYSYSARQ